MTKSKNDPEKRNGITDYFVEFSRKIAKAMGLPWAFLTAILVIVVWGVTGPVTGFSDTWQLIINTGTTIVTFLMVFLIQSTQNRDSEAMHLKMDELIRVAHGARRKLIDLEELSEDELDALKKEFEKLHNKARKS